MSQASNIVLADSVPANHTFSPISSTDNVVVYRDADAVTAAGKKQIQIGFSPISSTRDTERTKIRFDMPIENTVDGRTVVVGTNRIFIEAVVWSGCTATERANFYALAKNLAAHAVAQAAIRDGDPPY